MNRYREYYKEYQEKRELRDFVYTWVDLIKTPLMQMSERFEALANLFKTTEKFDFSMQRGDFLITPLTEIDKAKFKTMFFAIQESNFERVTMWFYSIIRAMSNIREIEVTEAKYYAEYNERYIILRDKLQVANHKLKVFFNEVIVRQFNANPTLEFHIKIYDIDTAFLKIKEEITPQILKEKLIDEIKKEIEKYGTQDKYSDVCIELTKLLIPYEAIFFDINVLRENVTAQYNHFANDLNVSVTMLDGIRKAHSKFNLKKWYFYDWSLFKKHYLDRKYFRHLWIEEVAGIILVVFFLLKVVFTV